MDNKTIKSFIDLLFFNFLCFIEDDINHFSIFDTIKFSSNQKTTIKELYTSLWTILDTKIKEQQNNTGDSGLVFDAIYYFGEKVQQGKKINNWFKRLNFLLNIYNKYLFFVRLWNNVNNQKNKVLIGITQHKTVFFNINTILNNKKDAILEKVVFPWQITTDKNYFKNMNNKIKLPYIRGLCAEWQYKYLFDKPLFLWEKIKLQLLTRRYLVPAAVVGAGFAARWWWLKSKNKPVSPSDSNKKSPEPVAKKV